MPPISSLMRGPSRVGVKLRGGLGMYNLLWEVDEVRPQARHDGQDDDGTVASRFNLATASSSARASCSLPPSRRNATDRFAASRRPTTNMIGTLARLCSRTL